MPLDDLMLLRYVEDDLLPTDREMVARQLATDLEAQQKVAMLRSTGEILRRTFGDQAYPQLAPDQNPQEPLIA